MDYMSLSANELAMRCADAGDHQAWNEFVRRFQRPIALVVLRTAWQWGGQASQAIVDDLVQDTFLRLCANDCRLLREFVAREPDSIKGYLKVIATNVTHDHFRGEASKKRGGDQIRMVDGDTDGTHSLAAPEGAERLLKDLQISELHDRIGTLSPPVAERDQLIFNLYYVQGLSAREIAAVPQVRLTTKGVESSILRTSAQLRSELGLQPAKGNPVNPAI